MKEELGLERLMRISNALCAERDAEDAIRQVALNVCGSGHPAIIYISRITKDMKLEHFLSFGVNEDARMATQTLDAFLIPVLKQAIASEDVFFQDLDKAFLENFPNVNFNHRPGWKTVIIFSINGLFIVTITIHVESEAARLHTEYFALVKLLLSVYLTQILNNSAARTVHHPKANDELHGKPLTARQNEILNMIRDGLTNITIAAKLGYSESLIKQETIAIYQKLGIEGRKEINHTDY